MLHNSEGLPIRSVEEWLVFAPPMKGVAHWKDGRSAKELAKSWLRNGAPKPPVEFVDLLRSHDEVKDFRPFAAIPEYVTEFDLFAGPRNHDLLVLGIAGNLPLLVTVEAKADESFDQLVGTKIDNCKPTSKIPQRIEQLSQALLGRSVDAEVRALHYQLLAAVAATLVEAKKRRMTRAAFVVHEFRSRSCNDRRLQANKEALNLFYALLKPGAASVEDGQLYKVEKVPGSTFVPAYAELFLGKSVSQCEG